MNMEYSCPIQPKKTYTGCGSPLLVDDVSTVVSLMGSEAALQRQSGYTESSTVVALRWLCNPSLDAQSQAQ